MIVDNYPLAIKQLREKMMLSQQEFAKVLGVSFASINRWENGVHEPTIKVKRKLRSLFNEYGIKIN
jgi:DNA-binding transcriptional regulator YiaG